MSRTIAVYTSIFVAHDYVVVACAHDDDRVVHTTAVSDEGTRWTVSGPLARSGRGADRRNGSCGTRTRDWFQYRFFSSWSWNVPWRVAKENARNNSSSILSRDKWFFIHSFRSSYLCAGDECRRTDSAWEGGTYGVVVYGGVLGDAAARCVC